MSQGRRRLVLAAALLIGLPVLLALAGIAFMALLNPVFLGVSKQTSGTLASSDQKRDYLLHVPSSYDRAKPTPLVISLHAAALWPAAQMQVSQWNRVADRHGFLVVYPSGTTIAPLPILPELPVWLTEREAGRRAEARFLSDLIDALEAAYNIDPARIYVSGFSNGAGMALALACVLSRRVAAIGTVAAAHELSWSSCAGPRPVPLIAFHGTADPFVPYDGGRGSLLGFRLGPTFPPVPRLAAAWAERNRCGRAPVESVAAPGVRRLAYTGCAGAADVLLYTIQDGGHTWPGGKPMPAWMVGDTSNSVDASSQMWEFFREHPLHAP